MQILYNYMVKKDPEGPGQLLCPYLDDTVLGRKHYDKYHNRLPQKFKFIEHIGAYMTRYRCAHCGMTFRIDRTPLFRYQIPLKKYKIKAYKPNY